MKLITRSILVAVFAVATFPTGAQTLDLDPLIGTWNMSYDMGQGPQTGTIVIARDDDGMPKVTMSTSSGGESEARDVRIEGDELKYVRDVSAQGQNLTVSYTAMLVDGQLEGSFEADLGALGGGGGGGGGAAGGPGGATEWVATKAE